MSGKRVAVRSARGIAVLWCALSVAFVSAAGQEPPRPGAVPSQSPAPAVTVTRSAAPGSFVVVAIPLPGALGSQPAISYEVTTGAGVQVLGRARGQHGAQSGQLLLTLSVPTDASAGPLDAAVVHLTAPGAAAASVAIVLAIDAVRDLRLQAPPRMAGLYPGARISITTQVVNDGNFTDTVSVRIEAPADWEVEQDRITVGVPRGDTRDLTFRLRVPDASGRGDFFARLVAEGASDVELSGALVAINVADRPPSLTSPGPTVRASLVATAGVDESAGALQLQASGPLTDVWSLEAQGTALTGPQTPSVVRGLARVGTYVNTPTIRLWSERTNLTAGSVSADFGELTGVNAFGRGGSAVHRTGSGRRVEVLAARPLTFREGSEGFIAGARLGMAAGPLDLTGTAAHLDAVPQRLNALGVEARGSRVGLGTAGLGIAWRDQGDVAGLGLSAFAQHGSGNRNVELRAVHAPGGSRAFARAENELNAAFSVGLASRWDVGAGLFLALDVNAAQHEVHSRTWSAFQQYRVRPSTAARLEVRGTSFDTRSGDGSFGTDELGATAGVTSLVSTWFYAINATLAGITRTLDQPQVGLVRTRGPRFSAFGNGGWAGARGSYQVDLRYDYSDPSTGYRARQLNLGISADRVRVDFGERSVFLNGSMLYSSFGSSVSRANVILRAGAAAPLPNDLTLYVGAERNPFFRNAGGDAGWVFALRLEKATALPRLGLGAADGVVFRDLDGDGRRDDEEPGMPNVRLRRGGLTVTTDVGGAYRFEPATSGAVMLDVASVPVGWVTAEARGGEFAVVPTSQVTVRLQLAATPALALRPIDLGVVDVLARDARGREWLARRTLSDVALFDGLPAGEYTIVIDAARASEPLRAETEVRFVVRDGTPHELRVPLVGRPLRFGGSQR
jgi:hypothetical protein